jgi:hypothetical protein
MSDVTIYNIFSVPDSANTPNESLINQLTELRALRAAPRARRDRHGARRRRAAGEPDRAAPRIPAGEPPPTSAGA